MRMIDADVLKEMKFSGGMHDDNWVICVPLREVMENIDKAPTVVMDINVHDKWISIKDRLPKEEEHVLIWTKDLCILIDWIVNGKWVVANEIVTHWMPLPEPLKEEIDGHNSV